MISATNARRRPTAELAQARAVLGAALVVASLAWSRPAHAYHTEDQHITDESAYTLKRNQLRLGVWKLQYGVSDPVTIGTYFWPWAFRIANAHVKWQVYHEHEWAFSALLGLYHLDTKNLDAFDDHTGNATIDVIPFELTASYRMNDAFTLSASPAWTTVFLKGALDDGDLQGAGEGAVDNFQLTATLEWRLSRVTAFLFHSRYLVAQRVRASGDVVLHPDAFTTVEVHASGQSDVIDFRRAGSFVVSSVFSWERINLRTGLSFGHYNVPGINFVLGQNVIVPDFDLYLLF